MASRHLSRSIALQSLYEWDFFNKDKDLLEKVIERNIEEFGPDLEDKGFQIVKEDYKIITSNGHLTLGDTLMVTVKGADLFKKQIDLTI